MIKITTPATSANLGVGFDAFGLALDLNNVFTFEVSEHFKTTGFDSEFNYPNNSVINAYISFSKMHLKEEDIIPVHVQLIQHCIPVSRGLGSSASVRLAGVLAANEVHNLNKSLIDCASFASQLEGHPDNVFACAFGNFTSSVSLDKGYYHQVFDVSEDLNVYLMIPSSKASTEELRKVLPKTVSIQDTVFHLSRTIHVPKALKEGNLLLLKELLKDKLHEDYRYPFIPSYKLIQALNQKDNLLFTISGSGSTVLCLSKENAIKELSGLKEAFTIKKVNLSNGVKVEVIS